jgi:uncharacterized membrane protein YhaH (DUF805 family)
MNYFIKCFRDYAIFNGRSSRSEYWVFFLYTTLIGILLSQGDMLGDTWNEDYNIGLESSAFALATIVPWLSVSARRLHDIGKSGWMTLLWLLPIIGWIWILILLFTPSQDGENEFGAMPIKM